MTLEKEKLLDLFTANREHFNYQITPKCLENILGQKGTIAISRYEKERLDYILQNIDIAGKTIVDIGGNSGYFSFEMLDAGASEVRYFEIDKLYTEFVESAAKVLEFNEKISVENKYFSFDNELKNKQTDIVLLLNVLHNLGEDYGDKKLSIQKAKEGIVKNINSFAYKTDILVFQMGFNWRGDINMGIFEDGTKRELIDFVNQATLKNFEVLKIGIAERIDGKVQYVNLNETNIKRDDSLGEFLNRPLFIMKTRE